MQFLHQFSLPARIDSSSLMSYYKFNLTVYLFSQKSCFVSCLSATARLFIARRDDFFLKKFVLFLCWLLFLLLFGSSRDLPINLMWQNDERRRTVLDTIQFIDLFFKRLTIIFFYCVRSTTSRVNLQKDY